VRPVTGACAALILLALACATPPSAPAPPAPISTLVLFGDSITVGAGASTPEHAYAYRLAQALAARHRVVGYARGGWTVAGRRSFAMPAFARGAWTLSPDAVVIALGTNDYSLGVPLARFESAYRAILVLFDGVESVVCVTPFRRSETDEATANPAGLFPRDYRAAVRAVCEAAGRPVLDGFAALPSDAFLADGLHPNDAGHERIAEWLEEGLRGVLR
jgi:lysophospholipase L1-like esterase